jgi:hypothetical protein
MPQNFDINDLAAFAGDNQVHGVPRARAEVGGPSADATTSPQSFAPVVVPPAPLSGPNPGFVVPNHGDFTSRLPVHAAEKLRRLKSMAADLGAITSAASDRLNDAQGKLQVIEQRLSVLRTNNVGGRNDMAIKEASERADAARAERDRAQAELDARIERARPLREVVLQVERYVEKALISVDEISLAPPVETPTPRKGESYNDLVAAVRTRIEKHRAERQAAIDAPQPSEAAKQRARAEIEQLAEKGRPGVMGLLESSHGSIEWPQRYQLAGIAMRGHEAVARVGRDQFVPDLLPLVIWSHRDAILQAIEREIDERSDDRSALDPVQRAKKIAQAEQARFEAELVEERIIEQAEAAGVVVARRSDADPRAILGLSPSLPAPRSL